MIKPWNKGKKTGKLSYKHRQKLKIALKLAYKTGRKISNFKKGFTPWNKGTKGVMKANSASFKKGHPAPVTAFKKGDKRITGKNNRLWKGNNANYFSLHGWIYRHLGKAIKCENPNCIYPRKNSVGKIMIKPHHFEWANRSREYKREFSDWIQLCSSCHQKADHHKWNLTAVA